MPNYTALTITCTVVFIYRFYNSFYRKKLLIATNFLYKSIVNNKILNYSHHSVYRENRYDKFVLLSCFSPNNVLFENFIMPFFVLLPPNIPKLFSSPTRSVSNKIFIGRRNNLNEFKKLRNVIFALIPYHLLNCLFFTYRRGFTLNCGKRNTVYK